MAETTYQYYSHDGFICRRPRSDKDGEFPDPSTMMKVEYWQSDDKTWKLGLSADDRMQPLYYGMVITSDQAKRATGDESIEDVDDDD